MRPNLAFQRCFNHAGREAVAQCPQCRQFFCRECITEHEDRVVCAACLKELAALPPTRRPAFVRFSRVAACLLGLLLVWFLFFLMGQQLAAMPDSFHEGTLWRVHWIDKK